MVIDALNETKDADNVLAILLQMSQSTKHLKILLSSTEELGQKKIARPIAIVSMT